MGDLLDENLSEKLSTRLEVINLPVIPEMEYFIRIKDFEKSVLAVSFGSFLLLLGVFLV